MYIALSYAGIHRHILYLEEEKKKAASLKDAVQITAQLASVDPDFNPNVYKKCLDDLELLERSIVWRMGFLGHMADDFRRIADGNKALFDGLEAQIRQVHG